MRLSYGLGRRAGKRGTSFAIVSACLLLLAAFAPSAGAAPAEEKVYEIKFGTLAPEGTSWTEPLHAFKDHLESRSNGRVRMKLFPGGQLGDEKDMIRKMKLDQISAVGVSGMGLAQILPEVHVLDLPMLFENNEEVDYVYPKVLPHFEEAFAKKGFVLLGFTEVGFTYLFSKKRIQTLEELRKDARVWAWEGDPLVTAFMSEARIPPVSIAFTDVVMALQTGLLDTVYAPPYAAIALQWFLHVKYMSETPLGHATGGVLISKKKWEELPDDLKLIIRDEIKGLATDLVQSTRQANEDSRKELVEKKGIQVIPKPPADLWNEYVEVARQLRESQVGKIYPREVLDMVLQLRDEARAKGMAAAEGTAPAAP